jgi:CTD kinase subunit beta
MLEASGFDYRTRYPQKYLIKLLRSYSPNPSISRTAYKILLDLYRTFSPLKQTSVTMSLASLELACRLFQVDSETEVRLGPEVYDRWRANRREVMETMLDLLDLYTHFQKSTLIGPQYPIDKFIAIRISLNQEADDTKYPRYTENIEAKTNGRHIKTPNTPITPASPSDQRNNGTAPVAANVNGNGALAQEEKSPATLSPRSSGSRGRGLVRSQDGTVRFMLDGEMARKEKEVVGEYFKTEWEEYVEEVEEVVKPPGGGLERGDGGRNEGGRQERVDVGRNDNGRFDRGDGGRYDGGRKEGGRGDRGRGGYNGYGGRGGYGRDRRDRDRDDRFGRDNKRMRR